MTFDPLSGQGTAKSLDSAYHAVQAILHEKNYQTVCDQQWNNFLKERHSYYQAETRWHDAPFWSRRRSY